MRISQKELVFDSEVRAAAMLEATALATLDVYEAGADFGERSERWTVGRILLALMQNASLPGRCALFHRDRPDFELLIGDQSIGIETTRAIPENLAEAYTHATQTFDLSLPEFRWGARRKNWKKLRPILDSRRSGPGWHGNEAEEEWIVAIDCCVAKKADGIWLNEFDERWLFIYDDLRLPAINHSMLVDSLSALSLRSFDRVSVLSQRSVLDCYHGVCALKPLRLVESQ